MADEYLFFAPYDLPADRGLSKECSICNSEYSLLNSEHLCKRCMRSICEECVGSLEHPIFGMNFKESLHKICQVCKNETEVTDKYIEMYQLQFFTNSPFANQWTKRLEPMDLKTMKKTFHKHINEQQAANQLWRSLNFSLRQYVVRVCRQFSKQLIEETLRHCIELAVRYRNYFNVGIESAAYMILLVASHCDDDTTIQVVAELQEKVVKRVSEEGVKRYLEIGSQRVQEGQITQKVVLEMLGEYLECRMPKFSVGMGINLFQTEVAICFVNNTLTQGSHQQYEKGLAASLLSRQAFICGNISKVEKVNLDMLRNCTSADVMEMVKYLEEVERGGKEDNQEGTGEKSKGDVKKDAQTATARLKEEHKKLLEKEKLYLLTIKNLEEKLEAQKRMRRSTRYEYDSEEEDGQDDDASEEQQQIEQQKQEQTDQPRLSQQNTDINKNMSAVISEFISKVSQAKPEGSGAIEAEAERGKPQNQPNPAPTPSPAPSKKPRTKRTRRRRPSSPPTEQSSLTQQVILKKNLRIDQLNRQRDLLTFQLSQSRKQLALLQSTSGQSSLQQTQQTASIELSERKLEIEELTKQVQKLTTEKANCTRMNELLMRKFNELSKQLVEKEEVAIEKAKQEIDERIDELGPEEVQRRIDNSQCTMF